MDPGEHTWSLKQSARMLWQNASRLEQWVTRGHIKPEQGGLGRKGRRWTFRDLVKAKVLIDLAEASITIPAQLCLSDLVPAQAGQGRFILVRSPIMREVEVKQMGGGVLFERHKVPKSSLKVTDLAGATAALTDASHTFTLVINVDHVEAAVRDAIAGLSDLERRFGPVDEKVPA